MQTVKTAISLDRELFDQAEDLARSMKLSRSKLFVLALQDFIEHQKNRNLLDQINAAHADQPDQAERDLLRRAAREHRRLVEGDW